MKTNTEYNEEGIFDRAMDIVEDEGKAKAIDVLQGTIDFIRGIPDEELL